MVERLVCMQAQVPENPYVALWSRLRDFDAEELSTLIADRRVVRAPLMRVTIHLASARDCLRLRPLLQPLMTRVFRSPWEPQLAGADAAEVATAGRELLAAEPRTRAELSRLLAPRWPDADPLTLAYAVTFLVPLVQVPPRGLWGATSQATWAAAEVWLDDELDANPSIEDVVLRYLAAFGPASVADMRTWCGIGGLRAIVEGLRPQLRTFRDERGRELFDVPDGAFCDPGTPAPPRFLPEYDNLLLSHADRSRVLRGLGPGLPFPRGKWIGTLLVDGFFRAYWNLVEEAGVATLTVDRFTPVPDDPAGTPAAIAAEGARLLAFIAPDAGEQRVRFVPPL